MTSTWDRGKVEGLSHDGRPVVLFLCTHNAGRSQMALGFFTHLADPDGLTMEQVRPIRDEIERRVRALIDQLIPATT